MVFFIFKLFIQTLFKKKKKKDKQKKNQFQDISVIVSQIYG